LFFIKSSKFSVFIYLYTINSIQLHFLPANFYFKTNTFLKDKWWSYFSFAVSWH